MYHRIVLSILFIFSLLLTSCEPETLPQVDESPIQEQLNPVSDSGNEEAPIDDEKED